jgi:ketosteroid isomerase-like protein
MSAAENKKLLQDVFTALANGNSRPFVDSLSDEVRWTIIGTTKWSRTFDGKRAVLAELLAPLRAQIADRVRVSADRFIAEDDLVVVEGRGHNTTTTGKPYNNTYCWIYRLADGKIQELTEYMDTQLVATALGDPA